METEGSLPFLQKPTTILYPEPDQSNPRPPILFILRYIVILSSQLSLDLPNRLFPSGFPTKTLCN
jgi:hypothetical protein